MTFEVDAREDVEDGSRNAESEGGETARAEAEAATQVGEDLVATISICGVRGDEDPVIEAPINEAPTDVRTEEPAVTEVASGEEDEDEDDSIDDPTPDLTVPANCAAALEALLFTSGEPLSAARVAQITGLSEDDVRDGARVLRERLHEQSTSIELFEIAEGYQLRTKASFKRLIQSLRSNKPKRLSPPALETLAIIAYRQPIVKSDIEKLRGVDATPTLKTLLERSLIRIVGHQPTVGQPALYGTTEEFLKLFALRSLADLPTLRELRELDEDPGEEPSDEAAAFSNDEGLPGDEEAGSEAELSLQPADAIPGDETVAVQ